MPKDIVKLASDLIRIPSSKESPQRLQETLDLTSKYLSGFASKKFTDHNIPSLLFYNRWPQDGKFKIIFNAHLDIVPGKPVQYKPQINGDKLIGRGAFDMKAAAAVEIQAFKNCASKVPYSLGLQLVTDEETGGIHGTKHQIKQGVLSQFYLCGEQSGLNLGCDRKGVIWLKLTTHGVKAHGAYLWNGTNAISKLVDEITIIKELYPVPQKPAWTTTCNLGVIEGGITVNQVPDLASVILDIRHPHEDSSSKIINRIKAGLRYRDTDMEIIEDEPSNHTDRKDPLVRLLADTVYSVTGKKAEFVKFHGASDARHYSAVGTTALDFGPSGEGLHSDNEWVSLTSLHKYFQILEKFLLSVIE